MRGLFFQVVLFFKATFADDPVLMAREIEAHWREAITGGLGASQDCRLIPSEFKNDGIGLIEPSDRHAGSLDRLFHGFCKRDQYLALTEGQTFGIVEMTSPMFVDGRSKWRRAQRSPKVRELEDSCGSP